MSRHRGNLDGHARYTIKVSAEERAKAEAIMRECSDKPVRRVTTDWLLEGQPHRYAFRALLGRGRPVSDPTAHDRLVNYLRANGPQMREGLHDKIECSSHALSRAIKMSGEVIMERVPYKKFKMVRLRRGASGSCPPARSCEPTVPSS